MERRNGKKGKKSMENTIISAELYDIWWVNEIPSVMALLLY